MLISLKSLRFKMTCASIAVLLLLLLIINISIPMVQEYTFYQNTEKVCGIVNKVEKYTEYAGKGYTTKYAFYVSYTTLDGKEYNNIKTDYANIKGDNYKNGDEIIVFYDKNNPTKIGVGEDSSTGDFLVVVLHSAIIICLVVMLLKSYKKLKLSKHLKNHGVKGLTVITSISRKGSGRYRTYTVCYVVTNPITHAQMPRIEKTDASEARHLYVNQHITAYFDPHDPNVYCINI